jgi:hypothetical protein
MATISAETLTDEQIREAWGSALDRGDQDFARICQIALGTWNGSHEWVCTRRNQVPACDQCGHGPGDDLHVHVARERIVSTINARAKRGK